MRAATQRSSHASGVTLKIVPSQGSLDNLKRLSDPKFKVDVGFVQGGIANLGDVDELMSLGSVFYVPVLVFYRAPQPIKFLSQLEGKRISIGRQGKRSARACGNAAQSEWHRSGR